MDDPKADKYQNPSSVGQLQEASGVYVSLSDSLAVVAENAETLHASLNCNRPITDEIAEESQKNVEGEEDDLLGDSISLYVEFHSSESELGHQNADDVVGLAEIKEEDAEDCLFSVGDVVWVKTGNQNWWAGKIYPSEPEKIGYYLISHFGSGHVAWYPNSQLKPFYRNFAEMSKQSESENFLRAVEMAVDEFGKSVSSKLIKDDCAALMDEFGEISSIIINPKKLISYVMNLSVSATSVPRSALDLSIASNYLSSFYRSIGHLNVFRGTGDELTKSPLKEGNSKPRKKKLEQDPVNESGSSNVEGSEPRARKKSKYLSYPYVNLGKKEEGKSDLNSSTDKADKSPVLAKKSSKNTDNEILVSNVSIPEMLSVPSNEFLSELRVAAVEHAYMKESQNFDKVQGLFHRFRSFSYRDNRNDSKIMGDEEKDKEKADPSVAVKFVSKKRRKREKATTEKEIGKNVESKPGIVPVVLKKDVVEEVPRESFEIAAKIKEQIEGTTQINSNVDLKNLPLIPPAGVSPVVLKYDLDEKIPRKSFEVAAQIKEQTEGAAQIDSNVEMKNPPLIPPRCIERAINVPNLNGEVVSPLGAPKKRRRRSKEEIAEAEERKTEQSSVLQKRKRSTIGSPLILTFDDKCRPLPTIETLETELGKYGALKGVEFPVSSEEKKSSMARVIFQRKVDAKQASHKLTKTNPFGPILLKHELEDSGVSMALKNLAMRALPPILKKEQHSEIEKRRVSSAVSLSTVASRNGGVKMGGGETQPPLDMMKRNLEMMTSMLHKSGDNLSPETKAKLELEIKGLLGKVSTMVCSSSSSSS